MPEISESDLAPATGTVINESELAPAPAAEIPVAHAAARGALQGASMGFSDEIAAGIDTATSHGPDWLRHLAQKLQPSDLPPLTDNLTYTQRRDAYRAKNAAALAQHPVAYVGGEMAGGVATGGVGGIARNAIAGAGNAVGHSEATDTQGLLKDAAIGGVGGLAMGVAGKAAGALAGGALERATAPVHPVSAAGHAMTAAGMVGTLAHGIDPKHIAMAVAMPVVAKAASAVGRMSDKGLATLQLAAQQGNKRAAAILSAAAQAPQVAARLSGAVAPMVTR